MLNKASCIKTMCEWRYSIMRSSPRH